MERLTGQGSVGDLGAYPVGGAIDHARWKVVQFPAFTDGGARRKRFAEDGFEFSAAPDFGQETGFEFEWIKGHLPLIRDWPPAGSRYRVRAAWPADNKANDEGHER